MTEAVLIIIQFISFAITIVIGFGIYDYIKSCIIRREQIKFLREFLQDFCMYMEHLKENISNMVDDNEEEEILFCFKERLSRLDRICEVRLNALTYSQLHKIWEIHDKASRLTKLKSALNGQYFYIDNFFDQLEKLEWLNLVGTKRSFIDRYYHPVFKVFNFSRLSMKQTKR